jgi:hypothetical protein
VPCERRRTLKSDKTAVVFNARGASDGLEVDTGSDAIGCGSLRVGALVGDVVGSSVGSPVGNPVGKLDGTAVDGASVVGALDNGAMVGPVEGRLDG